MIDEERLIEAIRLHRQAKMPSRVDIQAVMDELEISNAKFLIDTLDNLKAQGYLTYQFANNKLKRIILTNSFPL